MHKKPSRCSWNFKSTSICFLGRFQHLCPTDFFPRENIYISSWLRVKVTWFILSPGPSHPPVNVSGGRLSSTSLFIYWAPVPLQHRGGLILGYNVSFWTPGNDSSTNITLTTEREEIPIKGLDKFTPYLVTVSAFNEFGDGVFSDPIEIWTDEDGRWKTKRLRITFYPCRLQFSCHCSFSSK